MAVIEKLSIQGIRSFGTDKPQKVEFFRPVTLVVGANGTGKTTIIECLKYVTAGELPPGTRTTGSFVHDPKLTGEATVRAKVGLQLRDVFNKEMIVTRSMEATQKVRNITCRTLESTIKRVQPDGRVQSLNQKCFSVDEEMATSLGVSKAVLEYVIFCHQEESNWPLMEGKVVKQRFDDIFASAIYVKALDSVRALKKEYDQKVKFYNSEVLQLKEIKDEVDVKERDLKVKQTKLTMYEEEKRKLTEALLPLQTTLQQYQQQLDAGSQLQARLDSGCQQRQKLKEDIDYQRESIGEVFEGSDEELELKLTATARELQQLSADCERVSEEIQRQRRQEAQLQTENDAVSYELGGLQEQRQAARRQQHELRQLLRQLAKRLGVAGAESEEEEEDSVEIFNKQLAGRVQRELERQLQQLELRQRQARDTFEEKLSGVEAQLGEAADERSRVQQRVDSLQQALQEREEAERRLRQQLTAAEEARKRLARLRKQLAKAEAELESFEQVAEAVEEQQRRVERLEATATKQREELNEAERCLDAAVSSASLRAELDARRQDLREKEAQLLRLRTRHEAALCEVLSLSELPADADELLRGFREAQSSSGERLRSSEEQFQSLNCQLGQLQLTLKHTRKRIAEAEETRRQLKERVFAECPDYVEGEADGYESALAAAAERRTRAEEQKALVVGERQLYQSFLDRAEAAGGAAGTAIAGRRRTGAGGGGHGACGLCDRGFSDEAEQRDHVGKLRRIVQQLPRRLRQAEEESTKAATTYEKLLLLRPEIERLAKVAGEELPALTAEAADAERRLKASRKEAEQLDDAVSMWRSQHALCTELDADVRQLAGLQAECEAAKAKVDELAGSLPREASSLSLEQLQERRRAAKSASESAEAELRSRRDAADAEQRRSFELRDAVNAARSELLAAQQSLQQQSAAEAELRRVGDERAASERQLLLAEGQLPQLAERVAELQRRVVELRNEEERRREEAKVRRDDCVGERQRLLELMQEVEEYFGGEAYRRLERQTERQRQLAKSREAVGEELRQLAASAERQQRGRSGYELKVKELQACKRLRQLLQRLAEQDQELDGLRRQLDQLGVADVMRRQPKVRREEEGMREERSRIESKRCELTGQIRELEKDLGKELFKTAAHRYEAKLMETRLTEFCSKDLAVYYRALDAAITQYHTEKMSEINKLIRDLWRSTYRGADIDYIEIRSDEDESAASKARRNYNYRVVMCKNGTIMDMRGRCSAGQKVLCSLIVRLALAEAFCHNCGILALDEPTTNLDRENIESLANSLVEIIRTRAVQQKNFQMIVITHDEEFVTLLGRSDFVDYFYRVQSNADGHSEIHRRKVEELHGT